MSAVVSIGVGTVVEKAVEIPGKYALIAFSEYRPEGKTKHDQLKDDSLLIDTTKKEPTKLTM